VEDRAREDESKGQMIDAERGQAHLTTTPVAAYLKAIGGELTILADVGNLFVRLWRLLSVRIGQCLGDSGAKSLVGDGVDTAPGGVGDFFGL
jgi:hypothetical protein